MSVELPVGSDLGNIIKSIEDHNAREDESERQKQSTGHRGSGMFIDKMTVLKSAPEEEPTIKCLLYTDGKQFELTRWYKFLDRVLGFKETMTQSAKTEQTRAYASKLRPVEAEIRFRGALAGQKRGSDICSGGGAGDVSQPPLKQLALTVPAQIPGSSSPTIQQTYLTGVSVPSSAKLSITVGSDTRGTVPSQPRGGEAAVRYEDFFQPKSYAESIGCLCDFLAGKKPAFKSPKAVLVRGDTETADEFRKRTRKEYNVVPPAMKMVSLFLPPVLTSNSQNSALYSMLPAGHVNLLMSLQKLFQPAKGIYPPFFLTPDSQELTYGVDGVHDEEMTRRSCFLELWRRALKLEGALAELVAYFMAIVKDVPQSNLTKVSPQTLGNVRSLLLAGAGLYGGGTMFWSAEDQIVTCLSKLKDGGSPEVLETIDWLRRNRSSAFRALYPCVDELSSILPILARVFSLGGVLCSINSLSTAEQLQKTINDERAARMKLYQSCCLWMILYGSKLTR
jgi:hypothetical protein